MHIQLRLVTVIRVGALFARFEIHLNFRLFTIRHYTQFWNLCKVRFRWQAQDNYKIQGGYKWQANSDKLASTLVQF
jgi:hypothetical protein